MAPPADVVVLSNRGPSAKAAGGLVTVLTPGARRDQARWLSAETLDLEPSQYQAYYDVVANGTLWSCLHGLWDLPRRPRFDRRWHQAWDAYRAVNERFAASADAAAAPGAAVLVHDYHLALVPALLAGRRPDLRIVAFVHTPWCSPAELGVLPDAVVGEVLGGFVGTVATGFHSARWAANFAACCDEVLGRSLPTVVAPAAPDLAELRAVAESEACARELAALDAWAGERRLVVRVDRMEPSKNLLRGFWAFDELLDRHEEWRGRVSFAAMVYPSRAGLADYVAYAQEAETVVAYVNARWGTPDWTPVSLQPEDNHARSVAALRRADVLLVNPVRDGLNLVAMEGPAINDRSTGVVLSLQAGCWDALGDSAYGVNPFDVSQTAEALDAALRAPEADRSARAAALRKVVGSRSPLDWWDDLLRAAGP
jgi:trehalose 6-phosphate synthase